MSTVNAVWAGVVSLLPAASTARTSNVCGPSASVVVSGVVQAAKAAPSRLHSNVAPASELNANVGELFLVGPLGPAVSVVSGAVRSTVMVRLVPLPSLPAGSVALAV